MRVALVGENSGDEFADVVFVVDDQNIGGHQVDLSVCERTGSAAATAGVRATA